MAFEDGAFLSHSVQNGESKEIAILIAEFQCNFPKKETMDLENIRLVQQGSCCVQMTIGSQLVLLLCCFQMPHLHLAR
jgi:hypothetical protein